MKSVSWSSSMMMLFSVLCSYLVLSPPSMVFSELVDTESFTITTHWYDLDGVVSIRPSPVSDHVFVLLRGGEVIVFDDWSENAARRSLADFSDIVYNFWDNAATAFELHPEFPFEPYAFLLFAAEPTPAWPNDSCPRRIGGTFLCQTNTQLIRIKLNPDAVDFEVEYIDQILIDDACTSSPSHHNGDMRFLEDGSLVLTTGDGAQFSRTDVGIDDDLCLRPDLPQVLQGAFRPQYDVFLHGKTIRIPKENLLLDRTLVHQSSDYEVLSKGNRNAFRMAIDPVSGDIFTGDVGSGYWDEINRVSNPLVPTADDGLPPNDDEPTAEIPNFGWPCMEGGYRMPEYYFEASVVRQNPICDELGDATLPEFFYRQDVIDVDNEDLCNGGGAAITGLAIYTGGSVFPPGFNDAMFFADGPRGCVWYFERDAAAGGALLDFSHAHTFLFDEGFITDIVTGRNGALYLAVNSDDLVLKVTPA